MTDSPGWHQLVFACSREEFARAHPLLFLVGRRLLTPPRRPMRTTPTSLAAVDDALVALQNADTGPSLPAAERPPPGLPFVHAIRKVQETFATMITVGRTGNNDIPIEDIQISKFHAFFRRTGNGYELEDAGSRNGTYVNDRLLEKGRSHKIAVGDLLAFAELPFDVCDAEALWDRLRAPSAAAR
jgi:hypothetical protein